MSYPNYHYKFCFFPYSLFQVLILTPSTTWSSHASLRIYIIQYCFFSYIPLQGFLRILNTTFSTVLPCPPLQVLLPTHHLKVCFFSLTPRHVFLVPGTGKSHQNTSAGKFDPERAVWNCWLLALLNDVIVYDVTTHATSLPRRQRRFQWRWMLILWTNSFLKPQSISGTRKIFNY